MAVLDEGHLLLDGPTVADLESFDEGGQKERAKHRVDLIGQVHGPLDLSATRRPTVPRISVVIPTYNHDRYIGACIESVLGQTYRDFEVIVVDDGSTDGTARVVSEYGDQVRYLHKENGGTSSALNAGIEAARGEYLAWLSSDDRYAPTKLAKQIAQLETHPQLRISHTAFHHTDKNGVILKTSILTPQEAASISVATLLKGNPVNGSSILFHRSCVERVGTFDESLQGTEDWEMWIRLAGCYQFGYVPEPLLFYRWHDANFTHKRERMTQAMWQMLLKVASTQSAVDVMGLHVPHDMSRRAEMSRVLLYLADTYWTHPASPEIVPRLLGKAIVARPIQRYAYKRLLRWYLTRLRGA